MFDRIGRRSPLTEETAGAVAVAESQEDRMAVPEDLAPFYVAPTIADARAWRDGDDDKLARVLMRRRLASDPVEWAAVLESSRQLRARFELQGYRSASSAFPPVQESPHDYSPTTEELGRERERLTDEDRQWWMHVKALEAAAERKAHADANAARVAQRRASATCVVCGVMADGVRGRLLGAGGVTAAPGMSPGSVRACEACAAALDEVVRARACVERLGDGRTREQAAAAWLDANGKGDGR